MFGNDHYVVTAASMHSGDIGRGAIFHNGCFFRGGPTGPNEDGGTFQLCSGSGRWSGRLLPACGSEKGRVGSTSGYVVAMFLEMQNTAETDRI